MTIRDLLNKIKWDPGEDPEQYTLGVRDLSPNKDEMVLPFDQILDIDAHGVSLLGDTHIPFHRILRIEKKGKPVWCKGQKVANVELAKAESPATAEVKLLTPDALAKHQKMKIGARVTFNTMEELSTSFENVDFPVELALPYRPPDYEKVRGRLSEVEDFLKQRQVEVISTHATQAPITDSRFLEWGLETGLFSDRVGGKDITIHPNKCRKKREERQALTLENLRNLQTQFKALLAIETFGGSSRVFRPDEIMKFNLPMVLDLSHVNDDQLIWKLLEVYYRNIVTVHVSSRGEKEHHLPVNDLCVNVVRWLYENGWQGNIILEYLPWHHYRVRDDIDKLRQTVFEKRDVKFLPLSDQYRNESAE